MRTAAHRWTSALTLTAASLIAANGEAAEAGPRVTSFEAASGCDSRAAFVADVRAHTRVGADDDGDGLSFSVRVESLGPDRIRGTLEVQRVSGAPSQRTVNGTTCEEVLRALALVTALTIDPEGGGTKRELPEPPTALTPAPAPVPAVSREAIAPTALQDRVALAFGAHAAAQAGAAPGTIFTIPVFVELAATRERSPQLRVRFAPAARLGFVRGSGDRVLSDAASASFTWTTGQLDLCPVAAEVPRVALVPCARLELGALTGEGERIQPARTETRLWAALAVPVRLRVALTRWLFVEIEGAMRFPLQRERFVFQPDFTVFRAPAAAWSLGAGGGITFP